MKRYTILLILLTALVGQIALAAPAPIDFNAATLIKPLKRSFDFSIDLYQSTAAGADHNDKYFTARTILRLGPEISEGDQRAIRNEICASWNIYSFAANRALLIRWMPGPLGVYLINDRVVSVADDGLTGEQLDSVLRKLSRENDTVKRFAAKYYAVAMTKNLEIIHRSGIVWNNAHLRNFYVRPDGALYAYDFSEAELPAGGQLVARQQKEWKEFVVNTIGRMYNLLFPTTAQVEFLALVNATGGHAANWRTFAWDLLAFIAELNAALPAAVANNPNVPMAGGLGAAYANANNATDFLIRANNVPYRPDSGPSNDIARADHISAQDNPGIANYLGAFNFALANDLRQLLTVPPGNVVPAGLLPAVANETGLCNNWTGQ